MFQLKNTYRLFIISMLILLSGTTEAQFISKVLDYTPAPGQYTNADNVGTPAAANSIVGTNKGMVSLGAWGGSITVYFPQGIQNDPSNPYGVDFTVYGNPTLTWSEPGIIQVMKDENNNGLPDDTWYEIAGSDHFWNTTISNYAVTYKNSGLNTASDIPWSDNLGATGVIPENSFHLQSYYPRADLFPQVAKDQYTLTGTRITGQIDLSNTGNIISYHRAFGYADNTPVLSYTEKLPDNPYTPEIEGSGGDAIDIDWAVDKDMKPVHLDVIHFIRIYTGMNAIAGWLGEISTDITGIRVVEPATVSGMRSMIVIQDLPGKIRVGEILNLNAIRFESGIPQENSPIVWTVSNTDLASIVNGQLIAKNFGTFLLRAASVANPDIYEEKEINVFSVGKVQITLQSNTLKVNDKLPLTGKLTDQNGNLLSGITTTWQIDNEQIANIVTVDGQYFLKGNQVGKSWLHLEVADMKSIRDSILIEVIPESVLKKVYLTIKTNQNTIIPRHSVWVEQVDLTARVDRNQKLYGLNEISFVSLAHAVASAFKNTELDSEWAFRDDAVGGSSLYLYKVPEIQDGSIIYNFGYGGSRTSATYRKTWIVMLNQQSFVSGFDKIKVNNDDEILIYQVIDNSLPWTLTQLTSGTDTVKTNQSIDIQLKQYSCTMDSSRTVAINSSDVIAGQSMQVVQENTTNPGINLTTDELGKASFSAVASGDYLITSGIDESLLAAQSTTANAQLLNKSLNCRIYPNPFSETIRIDCASRIETIQIVNVEGKLVYNQSNPSTELNLSAIPQGIYIVRVISGAKLFIQKIVKN
jgi:hypothetical protein